MIFDICSCSASPNCSRFRAGLHPDREADRRLAIEAEHRRRRIGVSTRDRGDLGQRKEAVVDPQIDRFEVCLGFELAADPHADPLRPRLEDPGRGDGVLRLQRRHDRLGVEAKRCHLPGRELEEDHFILRADDVDLADIRNGQDLRADVFDLISQLALAQAVAGEGIDVAEHVTEAIVEGGPDHALRKVTLDVGDHVAHARPGGCDVARLRRVPQVHENGGLAGDGHAFRVIEQLELLELLFDPVRDLTRYLLGGGTRPLRANDHRLDGEVGIFFASELQVGEQSRNHEGDHEIPDERAVLERPVGEIERLHCACSCSIRTF